MGVFSKLLCFWRSVVVGISQPAVTHCLHSQAKPPAAPVTPLSPNTDLGRSWWESQRWALENQVSHAHKDSLGSSQQAGKPQWQELRLILSHASACLLKGGWVECGWRDENYPAAYSKMLHFNWSKVIVQTNHKLRLSPQPGVEKDKLKIICCKNSSR